MKKRRGEINDLAENTFYLIEKIVFYLSERMNGIRGFYKLHSPLYFFDFLASFGKLITTALNCIKSENKEALLRYFESHLGFKAHQFENEIQAMSQLSYDHLNLTQIFNQAEGYLKFILAFVSKAENLEYHSVERVDVLQETVVKKKKLDIF